MWFIREKRLKKNKHSVLCARCWWIILQRFHKLRLRVTLDNWEYNARVVLALRAKTEKIWIYSSKVLLSNCWASSYELVAFCGVSWKSGEHCDWLKKVVKRSVNCWAQRRTNFVRHVAKRLIQDRMNDSSSWNCFSWNRRKGQMDSGGKSPGKHQERRAGNEPGIPDEQFANLLGGKWTWFKFTTYLLAFLSIMERLGGDFRSLLITKISIVNKKKSAL